LITIKAVRAYLSVESVEPITVFTGCLVKTFLYSLSKGVRLLHGIRGIISPLHISPLFTPNGKDYELGDVVTPHYVKRNKEEHLIPITLNGEYIIHVGGEVNTVNIVESELLKLKNPLAIRFNDAIVTFKVEGVSDVTQQLMDKNLSGDKVTVYMKGPVKLFNIYTPSKLPKFNISAPEVLMVGYMMSKGIYTLTETEALKAMRVLGLLVETYYSANTARTVLIPYKGKEPALMGKITYIIDTKDENIKKELENILKTAETVGIGESRQNGFGTIAWTPK